MDIEEIPLKRRRLLRVISENGGNAHTGELTSGAELPNDVVGYHMRALVQKGFVERAGEVDVGAPLKASNYSITELGREVVSELPDEITPQERKERDASIEEVERSVVKLEKENKRLRQRIEDVEGFEDRVREVEDRTEKNGNAISYIKNQLLQR